MVSSLDSGDVIRSWTFPSKEADGSDLEESTAADEYFSSGTQDSMSVIEDIMNDLLNKVTQLSDDSSEYQTKKEREPGRRVNRGRKLNYQSTITSHSSGVDTLHSHMLLYRNRYDADGALYCLETLRNILLQQPRAFLVSSSTTGLVSRSPILKLLARHKKSLFGRGFSGDLEETSIRSSMYLEVMMMVCLYYLRSYYPNLETLKLAHKDVVENKEVQISSAEVLTLLCSELIRIIRESSRSLACYLSDLFSRLKLYKVVLHTVITSLHHQKYNSPIFTHQVLKFNEGFDNSRERMSQHSETLLKQQIKLLLSLIILEYEIIKHKGDATPNSVDKNSEPSELKYLNGRLIPHQPLFLQSINKALDVQPAARHTHGQWTDLITCALPYLGGALSKVVTTALKQICHNIEVLSECYSSSSSLSFPPDYGIKQLEALTIMCHYCLLDTSAAFNQSNSAADDLSNTQVFNNLTHLFMPPPTQTEQSRERVEAQAVAKKSVLGHLPRVIASISILWHALVNRKDREGENCEVGSPLVVKQKIVEFLSPLAVQHASSFLAAMAVVWRERRQPSTPSLSNVVLPEASEDQKVLVQLLIGIKAMPIHVLVQTLHQVVKQPALNQESAVTVEVSALELFVNYAQHVPTPSLLDSWPSLIHLFKEAPSLSPPAQFLLIGALSQFVHRAHITDKKDLKELQEITVKLIESCTTIVGACLEQTTWIRKNLAVREEDPIVTPDKEDKSGSNSLGAYSISALNVLAQLLAPLLDVTFGSQEKERVVTILNNLMVNVVPYLKNHTQRNAASYYACSQLLASLSTYQYTRKAWKKDVIDLMFDSTFFQMEPRSLKSWQTIIDNLINQETATFRDFMNRVSMPQGSSFAIFSSKDQEYEQRAQLLKRLALVIYCSDIDRFAITMPEFQERLAESTKIPHMGVLAQVFLCFRVLLLRMSPSIIIPLWPTIISEILQVMILMEHDLSSDFENFSSNVRALMSTDWNWGGNNGPSSQALWLQLQLAAANLLFLAVQLPADRLPQFQMYRWAFVGGDNVNSSRSPINVAPDFVPHVVKIAELMDLKFGTLEAVPTPLLPSSNQLTSVEDLHPFFCAMRSGKYTPLTVAQVEHQLELDILDSMAPRFARPDGDN
uniref:Protein dopey-1 n=2 Tax=Lygus hesperus TaxID=30085 RepID=A0A0K8T476_LYGHE